MVGVAMDFLGDPVSAQPLYVAAAHREIDLALDRGALAPETASAMRDSLSNVVARQD